MTKLPESVSRTESWIVSVPAPPPVLATFTPLTETLAIPMRMTLPPAAFRVEMMSLALLRTTVPSAIFEKVPPPIRLAAIEMVPVALLTVYDVADSVPF